MADDSSSPSPSPWELFRKSVLSSLEKDGSKRSPSAEGTIAIENNNPLRQNGRSRSKTGPIRCEQQLQQQHSQHQLLRRQSSLFSHLPVRSQSRLSDTIGTNMKSSSEDETWLHDEPSTQLGATQLPNENSSTRFESSASSVDPQSPQLQSQQRPPPSQQTKSSLFGTVMRKLGSGITDVLPGGSPFTKSRKRTRIDDAAAVDVEPTGSASLLTSPSGKTLMSFVNRFNSPFKFQSPKANRRTLASPTDDMKGVTTSPQYTPSPKRRRLDMCEGESKGSSRIHDDAHSRSSLRDGDDDDVNWKETSIVDNKRLEILDWTLRTHVRIEFHTRAPSTTDLQSHKPDSIVLWSLMRNKDWKEALIYWEYRSKPLYQFESTHEVHEKVQKSIGIKGRQGSFNNSGLDGASKQGSVHPVVTQEKATLAKGLIQSVRGPKARFSRKNRLTDDRDGAGSENLSPMLQKKYLQRQWQQSLRSLYLNYAREIKKSSYIRERDDERRAVTVGESYFYCIGEDHVVLFRVAEEEGHNTEKKPLTPSILVSNTSENCRQRLEDLGVGHIDLLDTIEELENETLLAHVDARQKAIEADQKFMSPSVKADLEALRRARAFGESAGADVYVKVSKTTQPVTKAILQQHKAIKLWGWENVSLFFEFYLNSLGSIQPPERDNPLSSSISHFPEHGGYRTPSILPTLIADGGHASFEHSSMRMLNVFPVGRSSSEELGVRTIDIITSIDVCGIILPGALRRMVVAARNQLMAETDESLTLPATMVSVTDGTSLPHESSRCMVLHSMRPKLVPCYLGRLKGTLVFNQGGENAKGSTTNTECPRGKLLQLVVWDSSREHVAACKLENAVSDIPLRS